MDRLKPLRRWENITLLVAVFLAILFLVVDLFQPDPDRTIRLILIILGVLATGLLAERLGYLERIQNTLDKIKTQKAFLQVPESWKDFEQYCEMAEEFFVAGGSLAVILSPYGESYLKAMVKRGCKLRFILLNPNNVAIPQVAAWAGYEPETFKNEIQLSLTRLKKLIAIPGSDVEVRLNNSIPALTIMGFDPGKPHGLIKIDINVYQCPAAWRYFLELTHNYHDTKEDECYQRFFSQFILLWNESEPWPA